MQDIRLSPEGIMLRPTRNDLCVRRRAAEMALPEVKRWRGLDPQTDAELMDELAKYIGGWDGFEIVTQMERDGWCGNAALVEIMDQGWISDAERELVRQWVRCLGIGAQFASGDIVQRGDVVGEVVGFDDGLAQYKVHSEDQSPKNFHVFNAEEVKAAIAAVGSK